MSGELWIIPAERRYFSCARGAIVHFAEVYLQPKFLDELLGKHVDTQTVRARTGHYDHFLYHCVQRLAGLIGKKDDVSQMTAHSLSQTLFLHFFSEYTLGSDRGTIAQNTVALSSSEGQLLREYIHERLSEHISLDDLAALVKMKTHDLLMAFPRSFGNTPAQYVIEQRLRRARWLLSETNRDIARIALETGFASHSHLTTTFRTRVGLTPHQFRLSKRIA